MRIITVAHEGHAPLLELADVPTPVPGHGEVLIRVHGAGVNRADVLQRQGLYPSPEGWPTWPGLECSGVIESVGAGVSRHAVGDAVVALVGGGAYAEYVVAPADLVLPAPSGLTLVEAAGVMEAACTVWSNLAAAHAVEGESLLVHGGSGGIGTLAVQLARARGMRVFTTAGGQERTRRCSRDLGADVAIDHLAEDFVDALRHEGGADVILDVVGAAYLERNVRALATGGRLVVIGLQRGARAELDLGALLSTRAAIIGTTLRSRPHHERADIVAQVGREVWPLIPDRVRPIIHATVPFERAQHAHDLLDSGEVFGKVVLIP